MDRREFLQSVPGALACSAVTGADEKPVRACSSPVEGASRPIEIASGPQLFLDDFLVERMEGLRREVQSPQRLDHPVLDSKTFGTTQPYASVLRDSASGRYRIFYNNGPSVWH